MQPDVSFDSVETLQPVPRLVYGLLRSPVLMQAPGHHPDLHTALRLLWTALPPEELRRAVYPLLSSYTTPDVQVVSPAHHVSAWCPPEEVPCCCVFPWSLGMRSEGSVLESTDTVAALFVGNKLVMCRRRSRGTR